MKLEKEKDGHWFVDVEGLRYQLQQVSDRDPQSFEVFEGVQINSFVAEINMENGCLIADIAGPVDSMTRVYETLKPKGIDSLLPGERDHFLCEAIKSIHNHRKQNLYLKTQRSK